MRLHHALLAILLVAGSGFAAEDKTSTEMRDAINARIAERAKQRQRPAPTRTEAAAQAAQPARPASPPAPSQPETAKAETPANAAAEEAKKDEPMVLDPVEVRKRKLSEFEDNIRSQEKEIIREKKLTVPTELDKALNDSAISKALAIFGGESNEYRASIASERVSMMEDEKDLIEAIHHAKTKEEKQMLQKQLQELKKMRRELEKALR